MRTLITAVNAKKGFSGVLIKKVVFNSWIMFIVTIYGSYRTQGAVFVSLALNLVNKESVCPGGLKIVLFVTIKMKKNVINV